MKTNTSGPVRFDRDLISVIVPIYNVEDYLPHCVDSILAQTYQNLEIILVDDGSPDRCGEICDDYARKDKRVKVIHKENGGQSSARNRGLDICKGKYISFVDSDDFVSPYFIEILYKALKEYNSDIATVTGCVSFLDAGEKQVHLARDSTDYKVRAATPQETIRLILYQRIPNGFVFRLYKSEIFKKLRMPEGWIFEDAAATHRTFMCAKSVSMVEAVVYAYRLRMNSTIRMPFSEKKMVAIQVGEQIVQDMQDYDWSLLPAAYSRAFACIYSVFTQVPYTDKASLKKLWQSLLLYRDIVAHDTAPEVRLKNHVGAWCTYLGMNVAYGMGRLNRAKNHMQGKAYLAMPRSRAIAERRREHV